MIILAIKLMNRGVIITLLKILLKNDPSKSKFLIKYKHPINIQCALMYYMFKNLWYLFKCTRATEILNVYRVPLR